MYPDDIDWVPSVNVAPQSVKQEKIICSAVDRYKRRKNRQAISVQRNQSQRNEAACDSIPIDPIELQDTVLSCDPMAVVKTFYETFDSSDSGIGSQTDEVSSSDAEFQYDPPAFRDMECQTDITCEYVDQIESECSNLRSELQQSKSDLLNVSDISEDSLKKNDKKVLFYTGLPTSALLMVLCNHIESCVDNIHRNAMSKFNEILLTLIKLRLNVPLKDLAFCFKISESTAGRIFEKWVHVMKDRLNPLVQWPKRREHLQSTMPGSFVRAYGNKIIAVFIDCFEVFVIRPGNMLARAITWSYYKHHKTVKFFIGIAPQGNIIYISKGWGGRTSNKYLTENCGLLDKIIPGDVVMANRGFNIADSLNVYNSSLLIPAFTRGKDQLTMLEIEESRNMSNLRIHLERVIGVVRSKYTILKGTLPLELLVSEPNGDPLIDDIAIVCCGLVNMCPTIVPLE